MKADNFGNYIRYLRNKNNIGQRELARIIGTSASYLNDIEKNKRPAPREEILDILFDILKVDKIKLYDFAGESKNTLPPDITKFKNKPIKDLLRVLAAYKLDDDKIKKVNKMVTSMNAKAIIIAAGMGTRLKNLTQDIPKCMLNCGGKNFTF